MGGLVVVNWDYSDGPRGPAHWHELKCDWAVCKTGKQQSPILVERKDLVSKPNLGPLKYEYRPGGIPATIVNEGHAVVVSVGQSRDLWTDFCAVIVAVLKNS